MKNPYKYIKLFFYLRWLCGQELLQLAFPVGGGRRWRCILYTTRTMRRSRIPRCRPLRWRHGRRRRINRRRAVVVLRMSPQRPSITVTFATAFCFALIRFLVAVCQHMTVAEDKNKSKIYNNQVFSILSSKDGNLGDHLQMVLPFERFPTHGTDILSFITMGQLVFCQSGRVSEHFGTYLNK